MRKLLVFGLLVLSFTAVAQDGVPSQAPYYQVTRRDSTIHPVGAIGLNADGHFTIKENTGTFRLSIGGNNGLSRTFNNFQLGGSPLIKNTVLNLSTFTLGFGTWARFRQNNIEFGTANTVTGNATFVHGTTSLGSGTISAVIGGESATASGHGSVAMGRGTTAAGNKSFAGGWHRTGQSNGPRAGGHASFAFYVTDNNNTPGFGANAEGSAILGGWNNNIPSTSHGSAIIGGNAIEARPNDPFQTYVQNLNIAGVPDVLDTANHFLVREYSTGQIKTRPLSTLGNFWPLSGNFSTIGNQVATMGGDFEIVGDDLSFKFHESTNQILIHQSNVIPASSTDIKMTNAGVSIEYLIGESTLSYLQLNSIETILTKGDRFLSLGNTDSKWQFDSNDRITLSNGKILMQSAALEFDGDVTLTDSPSSLDTANWVLVREHETGLVKKRNIPVTYSGSYTPTATAGDNVNAVDMVSIAHYMRVGDQVHVYGSLRIDPDDDPGDIAIVYLTLPIASDFDAFTSDCVGYANEWSTSRNTALVLPETISDRAAIQFQIDRTDETMYFYHYTYTVK